MKNLFFVFFFLLAFSASAQLQFNTPFSTVAELSRNEAFRSRVGVAMYVRAGQALVDTVRQGTTEKHYEKLFASLIVTEGDNKYFVSLFTNAALTQGAQLATLDAALYAYVNALWPEIFKAWMYRNGYVTMQSPD